MKQNTEETKTEILSKTIMDSEVWYDHQRDCYLVKVDIWPKYFNKDQPKKSIIIRLDEKQLYWMNPGMHVPECTIKE